MHHGHDPLGNPITVQQPESVAAVAGFVQGFLNYQPSILQVLAAAEHDESLVVQACAAALWLFSESPMGPPQARACLARARQAKLPSTDRERLFAQAVAHWAEGDFGPALAVHAQLVREHPRDLAALKLGQYHAFNLGDSPTLLRLALQAAPAVQDVPNFHGLLAFGHEQCHNLAQAEAAARHALSLQPAEPWAEHALAHVMLTQGRHHEAVVFLQRASGHWAERTSFMRTHNWWHLALAHLELGEPAAALALYDQQVWGVDKGYTQDQVGAVSLLARLDLAGADVGPRWQDLATHLAERLNDQVLPFLDLQYLYGLARAERWTEAQALRAAMARHAPQAPLASRRAWQQVALPAADGLLAHARGDFEDAAAALGRALPQLGSIGGSHAQRDLFEQLWLDALARSGQWAAVWQALKPRADAQPESRRLGRLVQQAGLRLGLLG